MRDPRDIDATMPHTITLHDIPEAIHERLVRSARAHGRSVENEVLRCLSTALDGKPNTPGSVRLARARAIRAGLSESRFTARDIDRLKRLGRA